ncbi:MAG: hypothetical protein PUD20_01255 [bacterium]|nr:hypothetical protein [bacterium]
MPGSYIRGAVLASTNNQFYDVFLNDDDTWFCVVNQFFGPPYEMRYYFNNNEEQVKGVFWNYMLWSDPAFESFDDVKDMPMADFLRMCKDKQ